MVLVVAYYTPLSVTVPNKCDGVWRGRLSCYTGSSCRLFVAVLSVNLDLCFVRRTNDSDWTAAARQTSAVNSPAHCHMSGDSADSWSPGHRIIRISHLH